MKTKRFFFPLLGALLLGALVAVSPVVVNAAAITLTDFNSSAVVDPASQAGMSTWNVDGIDHLFQQWFWYRIGNATPSSIDTLNTVAHPVQVTQFGTSILDLTYTANTFTLDVKYWLTGGAAGSGKSDIAEIIRITNTSSAALDFHFYQYSDFDLNGSFLGDVAALLNANTIRQTKAGATLQETVVNPAGSKWEIDFFANTLNRLNTVAGLDLSNATSPLGPGDVTYAFQWDQQILPGGTFLVSKDKAISSAVPLPPSVLLLGSALLGLVGLRKYRKVK